MDAKKNSAETIAIAKYVPSESPSFWSGKTADASDQAMSAKTTSRLQWAPIRIPAIRPSSTLEVTGGRYRGRVSVVVCAVRPDGAAAQLRCRHLRIVTDIDQGDLGAGDLVAVTVERDERRRPRLLRTDAGRRCRRRRSIARRQLARPARRRSPRSERCGPPDVSRAGRDRL